MANELSTIWSAVGAAGSVLAAIASAIAAWKAVALSRDTARRASEDEARRMRREIEQVARITIDVAKRASSKLGRLKGQVDACATLAGSYDGSVRLERVGEIERRQNRAQELQTVGEKATHIPHNAGLVPLDLDERLPRLYASLEEARGLLEDAAVELEAEDERFAALRAERAEAERFSWERLRGS
jgi:hypothetical protein